ncbi:MAG: GTP-binding protein [Methanobacteriota archaeon]|nr:MAG: GTP-binding protein [Euryarchaeota archaeon]
MGGLAMVDDRIKRKILLLGDGAVGKTSLIRRFVVDKFADEYITTIGTKVTKKDLRLESPGRATDLTFMIWDVLGQKGYKGIQESAFQGAKGALLVYDVTRSETVTSLEKYWLPHLTKIAGPIQSVLVGNKVDLASSRREVAEVLEYFSETFETQGFLSSAKTGENVEATFLALAKSMLSDADARVGSFEANRAGVDVKAPTREGLRLAVEYLAEAESDFRNAADVEATKKRRLGWIKEAG